MLYSNNIFFRCCAATQQFPHSDVQLHNNLFRCCAATVSSAVVQQQQQFLGMLCSTTNFNFFSCAATTTIPSDMQN
jgi:hypothetical protein